MVIDFHTHIADFGYRSGSDDEPIAFEDIIARLDDEGIDQAVLLPIYASPEAVYPAFLLNERLSIAAQVLEAAAYRERIICFGNLDPRWFHNSPETDFSPFLDWFAEHGCRGIGEVTANIPFDDPRVINMFRQVGERGWPVVLHAVGFGGGTYGLQDDPGSPRLERLLQAVPETNIACHGPGFWADIAAGATPEDKMGYPTGPVLEEGAVARLLRRYPNLYCDMSAGSGFGALTRDPAYGIRFLNEFQDRVLFATDVCSAGPKGRMPHLGYLRQLLAEGSLSQAAFDKITYQNALRILP